MALSDSALLHVAERNVRAHFHAGVTTMRDNGARGLLGLAVRELTSRQASAPRLLVAGPPVTQTKGHMHWCLGSADGVRGIREQVRRLAGFGVDHIKLVASGGGTRGTLPYESAYSVRELKAAVDTAREAGLRTAAHCHPRTAIENAVEAGVDCIEHASFLIPSKRQLHHVGAAWLGLEAEFDPALAERIGRRGCYVSATLLGGYEPLLSLERREAMENLDDSDRQRLAAAREHVARKMSVFRALLDVGLTDHLIVSTDAGPGDTRFGAMSMALRVAVAAGMTPIQAIEAATRVAAAALGLEGRVGRLDPGLEADLLVVGGNVAADIDTLTDVRAVVARGEAVDAGVPGGPIAGA